LPRNRALISTAIVLVVGLHAVPVLYRSERGTLWPFMQYSMYKGSSPPGPIHAEKRRLIAVTARGAEQEVTPMVLGLSVTVLRSSLRSMAAGDSAAAGYLMHRLNRGRAEPFVELRVESTTYVVSDAGIVRTAAPPIAYHAEPSETW